MDTSKEQQADSGYAPDDFSYSTFTDEYNEYHRINSRLMDLAQLDSHKRIVDLGCGVGDSTRELVRKLTSFKGVVIYAVDLSGKALKEAASRLGIFRKDVDIKFVHGDAKDFRDKIDSKVDAIIYCNSIHYVRDKAALLSDIKRQLNPNGVFAFNSSFIQESHQPEDQRFYLLLMLYARRMLKKEYGLSPDKSDVESRNRLHASDYVSLVKRAGLEVVSREIDVWRMSAAQFARFCRFKDFIEGALPGIPLPLASKVLQQATHKAFEALGLQHLSRRWLHLVARQPA